MPKNRNTDKTVIFTALDLSEGGLSRFVLIMARAFVNLGYKVHIITFQASCDYPPEADFHYHLLPYSPYAWLPRGLFRQMSSTIRNIINVHRFDRYVRTHIGQADLIISNQWIDPILRYSRLPNILHVLHGTVSKEHYLNDNYHKKQKWLQHLHEYKVLVAVSRGAAEDYRRYVNERANITAILNPIDRDRILQLSQAFASPYSGDYLIHVGRFCEAKDHATLLRAYAQSARTLPLVLVGKGHHQEQCHRLVQELGIDDHIFFAGAHANPYPLMAHAKGLILSSRNEGMPLVLLEALALSIPVISTDCPSGPNEILPPHCLSPVADTAALAAQINALADNPTYFKAKFHEEWLPEAVAQQYLARIDEYNCHQEMTRK
ncbi:glycosyltransferase [Stenoxybacter acetivorans]|uniref:glycosyltransferase n=1 Tax=Stenoxybacter acetivorans TaxID=422441 RepID=UPI00068D64C8|nr:glycosyltransferase [Stenoxybacter acetivorans]